MARDRSLPWRLLQDSNRLVNAAFADEPSPGTPELGASSSGALEALARFCSKPQRHAVVNGSGREVFSLTLDRMQDLPEPCVSCIFWELNPALAAASIARGDPGLDKEAWLSAALLEWGSVGQIGYVDGVPAGYVTYAPPHLVPRATAFPTAPVSADAVMLMTARVTTQFAGQGLGRVLIQSAAKDVIRRGVRAFEAFGYRGNPDSPKAACVIPADFLTAVGFKTVREHRTYPRLRLDLRSALTWREDVEAAVERLLSSVRTPALSPPRRA